MEPGYFKKLFNSKNRTTRTAGGTVGRVFPAVNIRENAADCTSTDDDWGSAEEKLSLLFCQELRLDGPGGNVSGHIFAQL